MRDTQFKVVLDMTVMAPKDLELLKQAKDKLLFLQKRKYLKHLLHINSEEILVEKVMLKEQINLEFAII